MSVEARQQAAERQVQIGCRTAEELHSIAYNLESFTEGHRYLCMWEMGPVEGKSKVAVEPSDEDAERSEEDQTLKE